MATSARTRMRARRSSFYCYLPSPSSQVDRAATRGKLADGRSSVPRDRVWAARRLTKFRLQKLDPGTLKVGLRLNLDLLPGRGKQ